MTVQSKFLNCWPPQLLFICDHVLATSEAFRPMKRKKKKEKERKRKRKKRKEKEKEKRRKNRMKKKKKREKSKKKRQTEKNIEFFSEKVQKVKIVSKKMWENSPELKTTCDKLSSVRVPNL